MKKFILVSILLCVFLLPASRGNSIKGERVDPSTLTLITMLRPELDPELAAVHAKYIDKNVKLWDVDRYAFVSVVSVESGFDPMARNKSGAQGVCQIMVKAHRDKIKRRNLRPYEVYFLDNNYSLGCEIFSDAKKESKTLDETLRRYVGGMNSAYINSVKKDIGRCRALIKVVTVDVE
jgi:soluble lytic murein transglycosylase-like protein